MSSPKIGIIGITDANGFSRQVALSIGTPLAIGRDPANDVNLLGTGIADFHASVSWDGSVVTIVALSLQEPTKLDERILGQGETVTWNANSTVSIGSYSLKLVSDAVQPPKIGKGAIATAAAVAVLAIAAFLFLGRGHDKDALPAVVNSPKQEVPVSPAAVADVSSKPPVESVQTEQKSKSPEIAPAKRTPDKEASAAPTAEHRVATKKTRVQEQPVVLPANPATTVAVPQKAPATVKELCADRPNIFSRDLCESRACKQAQWLATPYCVALRAREERDHLSPIVGDGG